MRQSGTVNSSLTLRPSARAWAKRRWWGSQGRRPQNRQGREATNLRCALSRYRFGSPIDSTLLSMPGGLVERAGAPLPWPLRGATAVDRELGGRGPGFAGGPFGLKGGEAKVKCQLDDTGVGGGQLVLHGQGRAGPLDGFRCRSDARHLTYELVAQDGRAIGIEGRPPAIVAIPAGPPRSMAGGEYGGCPDVSGASRLRSAVQV